jgi:hypothetical protein
MKYICLIALLSLACLWLLLPVQAQTFTSPMSPLEAPAKVVPLTDGVSAATMYAPERVGRGSAPGFISRAR